MNRRSIIILGFIFSSILVYSEIFIILMDMEGRRYSFADAFYWVISTITTVGYGDITFTSLAGKIFSIIVMLSGVAYIFGVGFPFLVVPWIEKKFLLVLPSVYEGKDHVVVCGYNEFVKELISELEHNKEKYVVVVDDRDVARELIEDGISCVYGDMSIKTFQDVGVKQARCIVTAFKEDAKNAEVLITLMDVNTPKIAVVEDPSYARYLSYSGATRIVSAKGLLGLFMAKKVLDPITGKLSSSIKVFEGLNLAEIFIKETSDIVNKTLENSKIRERTGCTVVGMWKDGEVLLNPSPDEIIKRNSVLIAVGSEDQLKKLQNIAMGLE